MQKKCQNNTNYTYYLDWKKKNFSFKDTKECDMHKSIK